MAAGLDRENEFYGVSLVELAQCARQTGDLELASRALELVGVRRCGPSPNHQVLARFLRAQLLADQHDVDGARKGFTDFLQYWRDADRLVAEVARAREAMSTLK